MTVRAATLGDAAAINAVYAPCVLRTAVTFETIEMTIEARERWLGERLADPRTPVLVAATESGAVRGFANAAPFDPRGAYATSVKVSVFISADAQGQGLGRRLYEALFTCLRAADVHRAYALIVAPNEASVALHKSQGFAYLMTLDEVGRKFGAYYDVMWFGKKLR